MMFVCCHPLISPEAQAALALKTLCGFSETEIGHAFLTTEAAIAKRLTRAKQKIQEARVPFEISWLATSWRGGSRAFSSPCTCCSTKVTKPPVATNWFVKSCVRKQFVSPNYWRNIPAGNHPKTHALLALMLLNAARLAARGR